MAVSFYLTTEQYGAEGKDRDGNDLPAGAIAFAPDANSSTGKIYVKNVFPGTNEALVCFTPSDAAKLVGDLATLESGISDVIPSRTVVNAINYVFQELIQFKASTMTPNEVTSAIDEAISNLGTVYKYKGSVETYGQLPTVGVESGDVYNVNASGMNYAAILSTDSYKVNIKAQGASAAADSAATIPGRRIVGIELRVKHGSSSSAVAVKTSCYVVFDNNGNVVTEAGLSFKDSTGATKIVPGGTQVYHTAVDYFVYFEAEATPEKDGTTPLVGTPAGTTLVWDALGVPFSLEWQ